MNIYTLIWNQVFNLNSLLIISFSVILFFLIISTIFDLKYGIIPNEISIFLMIYGLINNILISLLMNNYKFFILSIVYVLMIFIVSFILWKISFWGGGDLKVFCSMSLALSFIDILYQFNSNNILNDFAFSSQIIFYPKIFSILINAILLSFPVILLILIYRLYKEHKLSLLFLAFSDFGYLIKYLSSKGVSIDDLREGMILEDYKFNNAIIYTLIELINITNSFNSSDIEYYCLNYDNILNSLDDFFSLESESFERELNVLKKEEDFIKENLENFNLSIDLDEKFNIFSLNSKSMLGLTNEDIRLIKIFYDGGMIDVPDFKIKIGVPFLPALATGYLFFLIFGDLVYLISSLI